MRIRTLGLAGLVAGMALAGAAAAQDLTADSVFGFVDADGDGALSFEEINMANPNVTPEVFARFDADGNGALSLVEFRDLFENGPPPPGF